MTFIVAAVVTTSWMVCGWALGATIRTDLHRQLLHAVAAGDWRRADRIDRGLAWSNSDSGRALLVAAGPVSVMLAPWCARGGVRKR